MGITVSLIALVISFALFVILCLKNYNPIFVALICAIFISLFTPESILSLFSVFLPGVAAQFQSFFLVYSLGGAFGYCLMSSGASAAVSNHLIRVFGKRNVPILIFVISTLFLFAGVASYQYAILAISLPLLKAANLPKKVALAAMSAGAGSVAFGTLCGSTNPLNLAPCPYLGTTTMAAPMMSIICTIVSVVFIVAWLNHLVKKAHREHEGFQAHPSDVIVDETDASSLPPAWKGYLSLFMVFAISLVLQFVVKLNALQSVVFAQLLSIVLLIALVGIRRLPKPVDICTKGFVLSLPAIVTICMVTGYGGVVQKTQAFEFLCQWVLSLQAHPYIITFVGVSLLSGLCAGGLGGISIFMQAVGQQLAQNPAVNVAAMHRIMTISGSTLDSLPHNGAIAFQLSVFNLKYKEGYFQQFMMSVVVNLLASVVAVIIGILFY